MIGKKILHYKILEKLGEGGMGVVYLAEDTKLKRQVAIKFLPSHIAVNSDERKRFEIEAQAAAALNHPNIATIHNIEETEDEYFIVMEYISGKHLKDYVRAKHVVPRQEAIDVAVQIAKGLQAAHQKGIVHRDIKSANIMSKDDGQIKIMDFGLAKFRGSAQLTQIGTTVGTAAYMSPEQARGEQTDQRSDLWSLGVVLYEMLTGSMPFQGDYEQAVIYNIINDDPEPLPENIPDYLVHIINKLLCKDPQGRYENCPQLLDDLNSGNNLSKSVKSIHNKTTKPKWLLASAYSAIFLVLLIVFYVIFYQTSAEEAERKSIAVLPFINEKENPEIEYLADGITESLISNLSPIQNLKVMARATVFKFKDKQIDPQEIGNKIGVSSVLSGRVEQLGEQLIISAELIDVQSGEQIWGNRFNQKMGDVFAIEEEISHKIAENLKIKLESKDKVHLSKRYTSNTEAYEYYLKGRFYWNKRSNDGMKTALHNFNKAIEIDTQYALAWSGLADTYITGWGTYLGLSPDVSIEKSKYAADKALKIDNTLSEAYTSYGAILNMQWQWEESAEAFRKAIDLNPGYATAHQWYAELLFTLERFKEAEIHINKALEIDPLSLIMNSIKGWLYLAQRDADKAIYYARKTLEMEPGFADAQDCLAQAMLLAHYPETELFEEFIKRDKSYGIIRDQDSYTLRQAFEKQGLKDFWGKKLEIITEIAKSDYIWPAAFAECYAQLGDYDAAINSLEKLFTEKDPVLGYIKIWTFFDPLRSNVRFKAIIRRMNFPETNE